MQTILQSQPSPEIVAKNFNAPSIFNGLPSVIRDELRQKGIRRCYADGAPVQHRGEAAGGFHVIEKGHVKLGHFDADGDMKVVLLIGPGESFGELACLGGFDRVVDGQAVGDVELLWIAEKELNKALEQDPAVARGLVQVMAVELQKSLDLLIVIQKLPSVKRLAHALLAMTEGRAQPATLAVRQQDLAELIGVSRVTISASLTELEQLKFVSRSYGGITIDRPAEMRDWMQI
jgi:CRP/FNR family transcriptional regulator, cyclic AMP receptor protein